MTTAARPTAEAGYLQVSLDEQQASASVPRRSCFCTHMIFRSAAGRRTQSSASDTGAKHARRECLERGAGLGATSRTRTCDHPAALALQGCARCLAGLAQTPLPPRSTIVLVPSSCVPELGLELHSTYVGHPEVETRVTHRILGGGGPKRAATEAVVRPESELPVVLARRRVCSTTSSATGRARRHRPPGRHRDRRRQRERARAAQLAPAALNVSSRNSEAGAGRGHRPLAMAPTEAGRGPRRLLPRQPQWPRKLPGAAGRRATRQHCCLRLGSRHRMPAGRDERNSSKAQVRIWSALPHPMAEAGACATPSHNGRRRRSCHGVPCLRSCVFWRAVSAAFPQAMGKGRRHRPVADRRVKPHRMRPPPFTGHRRPDDGLGERWGGGGVLRVVSRRDRRRRIALAGSRSPSAMPAR